MDRRRTNQLLELGRNIISTTVALFTGHCVIDIHAERMQLPFNDFCHGCRSAEDSLSLSVPVSSSFRVRLTVLSFIDIKEISSFSNFLAGFMVEPISSFFLVLVEFG